MFDTTTYLNSLTLTDGATAQLVQSGTDTVTGTGAVLVSYGTTLTQANTKVLVLNSLSIPAAGATLTGGGTNSAQGTLDLTNNAMILNYTPGSSAAALAAADALTGDGSDGGVWDGTGITSSNAEADNNNNGYTASAWPITETRLQHVRRPERLVGNADPVHVHLQRRRRPERDHERHGHDQLRRRPEDAPGRPRRQRLGIRRAGLRRDPQGSLSDLQLLEAGFRGYKANGAINCSTVLSPAGFVGNPSSTTSITLSWPTSGASAWYLQRSADVGVTWTSLGNLTASATPYTDSGLNPGTIYYYGLSGYDSSGNVSPATVISAATQAASPTLTATAQSDGTVLLSWVPGAGDGSSFFICQNSAEIQQVSGADSYSVTGLTPGTTYTFNIVAADANNPGQFSPVSDPATATALLPAPTRLTARAASDVGNRPELD